MARDVDDIVWGEVSSSTIARAPTLQPGVDRVSEPLVEVRYAGQRVRVPVRWVGTIDEPPLDWRLEQPLNDLLAALGLD